MAIQKILFPHLAPYEGMPTTRYQGSKRKILFELHKVLSSIDFVSCLDAFGGTGSVTHLLRSMGKSTRYNDILPSNYFIAKALFANRDIVLNENRLKDLFIAKKEKNYSNYIFENYANVYFTDKENQQIDIICQNIQDIEDELARSEAYYCLFQATLSKRPYNLFHRANLVMRLRDVKRNFGNKATWDKPLENHMLKFYRELKAYRLDKSRHSTTITCKDAFEIDNKNDLVYIDTPYAKSNKMQESNYYNFYHFLDAMIHYDEIPLKINKTYPHKPFYKINKLWYKENNIKLAFKKLFYNFKDSILVISYRSDGYPSPNSLVSLLQEYYKNIETINLSNYKYVLSKNGTDTQEIAIVARRN